MTISGVSSSGEGSTDNDTGKVHARYSAKAGVRMAEPAATTARSSSGDMKEERKGVSKKSFKERCQHSPIHVRHRNRSCRLEIYSRTLTLGTRKGELRKPVLNSEVVLHVFSC